MRTGSIFNNRLVIAAIKDDDGLEHCLKSNCKVVFILYGTICNISAIIDRVKEGGKIAIVHADLINGLSSKEIAADYFKIKTRADGIISAKIPVLKRAMSLGIIAGQRTFIIDSLALESMEKSMEAFKPDFLEILPGVMPQITKRIKTDLHVPLIASGLVRNRDDIMEAFLAGADAVSTTKEELWYI